MLRLSTKNSGLTILEILVLAIIILILAALILPRFFEVENNTRKQSIEENMKIVQAAVKAYAVKNNGNYPKQPDDPVFRSFFSGGNGDSKNPSGGKYPENPYTHMSESPLLGCVLDVKQARHSPPAFFGGPRMAGKIFYNAITPASKDKPKGYAIEGADKDGNAILNPKTGNTYVLSNF